MLNTDFKVSFARDIAEVSMADRFAAMIKAILLSHVIMKHIE